MVMHSSSEPDLDPHSHLHAGESKPIAIASIKLPPNQPRKYFDSVKMAELAESIKENGVLEPIIVRPLSPDSTYELVAGERRLRASQDIGMSHILAIIHKVNPTQAQKIALVENLQREDLNPVEEVEAILKLATLELSTTLKEKWSTKNTISLLYRMQNEAKGKVTHKVMGSPAGDTIEQVFKELGLSWKSFISNKLPVLNWPDDVLEQTKAGQIAFETAKAIARVKDNKTRRTLLKRTITQSLSLAEVKAKIKALKSAPTPAPGDQDLLVFKSTVRDAYKKIAQHPRIAQDPVRLAQAEQLFNLFLTSLDQLLIEDSPQDFYD